MLSLTYINNICKLFFLWSRWGAVGGRGKGVGALLCDSKSCPQDVWLLEARDFAVEAQASSHNICKLASTNVVLPFFFFGSEMLSSLKVCSIRTTQPYWIKFLISYSIICLPATQHSLLPSLSEPNPLTTLTPSKYYIGTGNEDVIH